MFSSYETLTPSSLNIIYNMHTTGSSYTWSSDNGHFRNKCNVFPLFQPPISCFHFAADFLFSFRRRSFQLFSGPQTSGVASPPSLPLCNGNMTLLEYFCRVASLCSDQTHHFWCHSPAHCIVFTKLTTFAYHWSTHNIPKSSHTLLLFCRT